MKTFKLNFGLQRTFVQIRPVLVIIFILLAVLAKANSNDTNRYTIDKENSDATDPGNLLSTPDKAAVLQGTENMYYFSLEEGSDIIFLRLIKRKIGDKLNLTRLPLLWFNKPIEKEDILLPDTRDWQSSFSLDFSFGFFNEASIETSEQYFAVSGRFSKVFIMFILVLES